MIHELIYPIHYLNEWKHIFIARCKCGWESKTLSDSTRRLPYRDPHDVVKAEFLLHCKCARVQRDVEHMLTMSKHDLLTSYSTPHDWRLEFDNAAENHYTVICSCGYRSRHNSIIIRESERHYRKDITKLRKFIRAHVYTNNLTDTILGAQPPEKESRKHVRTR